MKNDTLIAIKMFIIEFYKESLITILFLVSK